MKRRTVITGMVGGLLAAPLAAEAQETAKTYRIAIVYAAAPIDEMSEARDPFLRRLFAELSRLGYTEGKNLVLNRWSGGGRRESYPDIAHEVVRWRPDVIFAQSGRLAQAFRATTNTIPVVTTTSGPVELGLALSLARPGGNVTGFSLDVGLDILAKRVELLKEAVPRATRFVYLTPRAAWEIQWGQMMREAGARAGVTILGGLLDNPITEPEYRRAFAAMREDRPDALVVSDHAEAIAHRGLIVKLAAEARLPAIYAYRAFAEAGGFLAYAADQQDISRQMADYIDRILKGANPGELPFQQPTKFELVINLKTAKVLGLTIPPPLLLRADQVIE